MAANVSNEDIGAGDHGSWDYWKTHGESDGSDRICRVERGFIENAWMICRKTLFEQSDWKY